MKYSSFKFFLFLFLFWGCSEETSLEKKSSFNQDKYLEKLPQAESINASLHNYEIILDKIKDAYNKKDFFSGLTNYTSYLKIFNETRVDDESEINYLIGKIILQLTSEPKAERAFFEYLSQNPRVAFNLGIKKNKTPPKNELEQKIVYEKNHFKRILSDRNNYFYEKKALKEVYLDQLTPLKSSVEKNLKEINNKNFTYLYFLVTRYPDFLPYPKMKNLFKDGRYIKKNLLNKSQKEKFDFARAILKKFDGVKYKKEINSSSSFAKPEKIFFPVEDEIIVRSRPHPIISRNLKRIELWQPFLILYPLKGEDEEGWFFIEYEKERYGFIRANEFIQEFSLASPGVEKFFIAYQLFLEKKFIMVMEHLSAAIEKQVLFLRERNITLMNKTINEIGKRATSLDSSYTKFALAYPAFFSIYENEWYLQSSDNLLFFLLEENFNSLMIQYFNGFDLEAL